MSDGPLGRALEACASLAARLICLFSGSLRASLLQPLSYTIYFAQALIYTSLPYSRSALIPLIILREAHETCEERQILNSSLTDVKQAALASRLLPRRRQRAPASRDSFSSTSRGTASTLTGYAKRARTRDAFLKRLN